MAKSYLHSFVSAGGTRARVFLATERGTHFIANVNRHEGFWNVQGASGTRLMPLMPHTVIDGNKTIETPLGVVLKLLREKIQGITAPTSNAA